MGNLQDGGCRIKGRFLPADHNTENHGCVKGRSLKTDPCRLRLKAVFCEEPRAPPPSALALLRTLGDRGIPAQSISSQNKTHTDSRLEKSLDTLF
jgi:hypothetical protein